MTSDAKIGLLLGLVFIFVIAFVINGLPTLRPQSTKGEVTTNAVQVRDEDLGVADQAQKAQETLTWNDLLDAQANGAPAPAAGGPETQTPGASLVVMANNPGQAVVPALPSSSDGLERLTQGLESIVKNIAEASGPAAAQGSTTEPAPAVEVAKSDLTESSKPQRAQAAGTPKPVAAAVKVGRTCVVQDGENLACVAKRVYGAEEGNRIVNIQRIYEANRDILKSPDEVRSGQELVIPPAAEKKPDTVLPKALFEKVQEVGKARVPADKKSPQTATPATSPKKEPEKPAAAGRWYVVQQDDNLWKIAASQLGSGARYQEIIKLNADILKNGASVTVGTRLRLPTK